MDSNTSLLVFKNQFFQDILKVEFNNIDNILHLLQACSYIKENILNSFLNYEGKYNELKNYYELIIKESDEDLKEF